MLQLKAFRMLLRSTVLLRTTCPVRHGVLRPLNAKKTFIRKTSSKAIPLKESFDVYAISDLHTDSEANLEWVRGLSEEAYKNDVLIVAGDISHKPKILKATLKLLINRFCRVAFVPGNHELWARGMITVKGRPPRVDSMGKLEQIMDLCKELGIITQPTKLRNLWLVPLLSWHHQGFDREPDGPDFKALSEKMVSDYRHCDWSSLDERLREHGVDELALHFDQLNPNYEEASSKKCDVISFSHFVPLQELIPEKRYLKIPFLAKVAGSTYLYDRIRALDPDIHVFGHTHIAWDININRTRFVQCPLGQLRERQNRPRSMLSATSESDPRLKLTPLEEQQDWDGEAADWLPVKIYSHNTKNSEDSKNDKNHKRVRKLRSGKMCESFAFWSEHYKRTQRKPEILVKDDGS